MRWYKHLYVGETAKKKRYPLISRIRYKKLQKDAYVITLPKSGNTLLDIYPSYLLLSKWYRDKDLLILGIASGKEEALETAGHIISDVYKQTGGFAVKDFFEQKAGSPHCKGAEHEVG